MRSVRTASLVPVSCAARGWTAPSAPMVQEASKAALPVSFNVIFNIFR